MRNLNNFNTYRITHPFMGRGDKDGGAFRLLDGLAVIASKGDGWDHVSVSLPDRTPTWDQMDRVKRMFFEDHETAMQLHLPPAQHINVHPHCLHLWRPHNAPIPLPPEEMV